MNEHERRAFDREGNIAKVVLVVLILALAPPVIWLVLWFEAAPNTSPFGREGGSVATENNTTGLGHP